MNGRKRPNYMPSNHLISRIASQRRRRNSSNNSSSSSSSTVSTDSNAYSYNNNNNGSGGGDNSTQNHYETRLRSKMRSNDTRREDTITMKYSEQKIPPNPSHMHGFNEIMDNFVDRRKVRRERDERWMEYRTLKDMKPGHVIYHDNDKQNGLPMDMNNLESPHTLPRTRRRVRFAPTPDVVHS